MKYFNLDNMSFEQDGAIAHFTDETIQLLNKNVTVEFFQQQY